MKISGKHFQYSIVLTCIYLSLNCFAIASNSNLDGMIYGGMEWSKETSRRSDILEPINRPIHYLNDFLYEYAFIPVTKLYVNLAPNFVRSSFKNFFLNLKYPTRFVSNILQLKIKEAYYESLKFGVNSTVGILGITSPSDNFTILNDIPEEDLGQVLAFWGIPQGPYIVIPILGPSSLRDLPSRFLGRKINIIDINSENWDTVDSKWITLLNAAEILSMNEEILPRYQSAKKNSIDFYTALRSAYYQQRDKAISE